MDTKWRAGFAEVGRNGLRFDLQTPWWHLGEAAQLAAAYPDSRIILNHTGLPADRSEEGLRGWKHAMTTLASCPNVTVKISGLGQPRAAWTVAANNEIVRTTIDLFGAARCMFESNFPVDKGSYSYPVFWNACKHLAKGASKTEKAELFAGTAARFYRLDLTT